MSIEPTLTASPEGVPATSDYERVARAIEFIARRAGDQPRLSEIAAHVHLSPYHFQRLFSRWAGVTPKRFLQALTVGNAKRLLDETDASLLDVAYTLGLSSGSRLHDHFVQIEAVTPLQYRRAGQGLAIRHGVAESPFGRVFVAATTRGVCALSFVDGERGDPIASLKASWPEASLVADMDGARRIAVDLFGARPGSSHPLSLFVQGTNFQVNVWRALLEIPWGGVASYADVARAIGNADAARAVGRAIGANPVAFAIPCHRVIRRNGEPGGYRWGATRKLAIQAWERASA